MKCLICQKRKAVKIEPMGWMPCLPCRRRMQKISKPKISAEITTESIKEDRKIFKKDITQPFRNGSLSKEYVDAYPEKTKQMIQEGHITEIEAKEAKNVWTESEYYKRE
jgi:hypothetical protein